MDEIPIELIQPLRHAEKSGFHIPLYLAIALSALSVFSVLYYMIGRSLTKRLVDFHSFISFQQERELAIYPCTPHHSLRL